MYAFIPVQGYHEQRRLVDMLLYNMYYLWETSAGDYPMMCDNCQHKHQK